MVIEASGLQFLAEREHVPLVSGLRLDVEESYGRKVLVASHATWGGSC